MLAALLAAAWPGPACFAASPSNDRSDTIAYDVVIAGGSTAALAAALAAAEEGVRTLLIEPTDWPGGQITSSGVPAIDEAWHRISDPRTGEVLIDVARVARDPRNMTPRFRDMLLATGNPGRGWVSRFCFEPARFLEEHLESAIAAAAPELTVLRNAVVKQVDVDRSTRRILALTVIQRTPRSSVRSRGYDRLPSVDLPDWYDPEPSERFDKRVLRIKGRTDAAVFIDATEWGELLVLAGAPYLQGLETVDDDGTISGNDRCGQSIVFGFVQQMHASWRAPHGEEGVPKAIQPEAATLTDHQVLPRERSDLDTDSPNSGEFGYRAHETLGWGEYHDREDRWEKIWTYRRIRASADAVTAGDWSLQNWGYSKRLGHGGNDYPFGYLFLSRADAAASRDDWQGGVDRNVMAAAEQRALAWHRWFRQRAPAPFVPQQITLVRGALGSGHGLSMLPYIRDTRRSIGLDGFLLDYDDLTGSVSDLTGERFADRIALGAYPADIHPIATCQFPKTLSHTTETLPFMIPLRALTNQDYENLLVAGKTMAQDFMANSATRLHPIEWSTGTAVGVTASLMSRRQWSSRDALRAIDVVQDRVRRQTPIDWSLPD